MTLSVFDMFTVGIGPSSSHTVGPMRAAHLFVTRLDDSALLPRTASVRVELFGSLGATGHGHGSVAAVVLGLAGHEPQLVDPVQAGPLVEAVRSEGRIRLGGSHEIAFTIDDDVVLHRRRRLDFHSNGMVLHAYDAHGAVLERREYYSVGGGFVLDSDAVGGPALVPDTTPVAYPFTTGDGLLALTRAHGLSISQLMLANELSWRTESEVRAGLLHIWSVMRECVERGSTTGGTLPGGLRVRRRAAALRRHLEAATGEPDALHAMEWVTLYALAVNEENAAGGRVVTAPTNGAAGIVPAVLHYAARFLPGFDDDAVVRFLLTAAAVGVLFKENASISGAEVGCQGEVGSACAMAAAGLAEVIGASPEQVENAAEIGIEHNLGLTCDPVGGLVQIPCIERNAVASVKAITAARMARHGDGMHHVSLDKAITTMRQTGADMKDKYKETSRGGLALNVVEC
ncbi:MULTISPECIES: L-serine ammonia-lyase [Pseudonocardia]|uniref:L-serine dehydratase n=2 Tax=Pseudonocardia TaxID=1847 RepID=A0A1Y2MUV7_PSEAH|nr:MULTISPECIES: L-serine ammonia-lyase [Pseudonocardia]OSY38965.1 L-serine dehydratase 1 [Pseudonocardia autotrophica]TDN76221.1 L-serine dehydratase [Pseudonocardia autotrophica]BBG00203.1 L-serine dehydratase [Pseudonocardia autotrophica]GEC26728.1 L-serine dehydratase [Pseudonocardia saturnea]